MKKNNFCIVGFGKHTETKLIPALENINEKVLGVVSSKNLQLEKYLVFKNIDEALKKSTSDTIFIISTPPKNHFQQIVNIISSRHHLFVEKPIFVSLEEALNVKKMIASKNLFIVEIMMYKYTLLYREFKKIWLDNKSQIRKIKIKFLVPSYPPNTFRDEKTIVSSPLYDMGCYIIDLLVELDLNLDNLKVINLFYKNKKIEQITLYAKLENIEMKLKFGLDKKYKNEVVLYFNENCAKFSPFFYGRKGKKRIIQNFKNYKNKTEILDFNSFEKLFAFPSSYWLSNQDKRFSNMIKVNTVLDNLSKQVSDLS